MGGHDTPTGMTSVTIEFKTGLHAVPGQMGRQHDRRFHGARISLAGAGNLVGRAVVRAGPDDGQPDGPVHGRSVLREFHGDESLIVVHRDHEIPAAIEGLREDGVGGKGAVDIHSGIAGHLDGWADDPGFFITEESALARMGVESADGNAWRGYAQIKACLMPQIDGIEDAADRQYVSKFHQGDVDGRKDDTQSW